jgi:poly-gamma-glutamate capsule biosynthesis protein CapA/YwtB (metallophosphatase superfamily)
VNTNSDTSGGVSENAHQEAAKKDTFTTIMTVVVPLVSAVAVAIITQQTNLRVADLQRASSAATIEIEQNKLKDQQESRRHQFLASNLPKLVGSDEMDRQVARTLFLMTYPDDASDAEAITSKFAPDVASSLRGLEAEARAAQRLLGEWTIVIATDRTPQLANRWGKNAMVAELSPVSVVARNDLYAVTVGSYPSKQSADQALLAVRPKTRRDAYVVAMRHWCRNAKEETREGVKVLVCEKQ